jgi:hypothetical protein
MTIRRPKPLTPSRNWLRSWWATTAPRPRGHLGVQQLEGREVPAVDLVSALGIGSDAGDSGALDVSADAAGNSYVVGYFSGTADFDPDPVGTYDLTARGTADAYVAKYDPDGALVWVRRMGGDVVAGASDDRASAVAVDGSGNVVVAGQLNGSGDFGGVALTAAGGRDGFVAKIDPSGQVLWAKRWGAANNDEAGFGVGADAAGNVYALGDRQVVPKGNDVLKFGPTGSLLWTRSLDIAAGRAIADGDLAVDAAGNVYVADTFAGTVDFDPGPKKKWVSSAENQGFVLKLAAGAFSWVGTFRGVSPGFDLSRSLSLALDGGGNLFVGGWYIGSVDFDPGPSTATLPASGNPSGFVTKLTTTTGAFVRAKALVNATAESLTFVLGLAADAFGNVYATGYFSGTADFDPGAGSALMTSGEGTDAFVVALAADGSFGWVETFGGSGTGRGFGVAVDPSGTVHLAGSYQGTVDFDPDPFDIHELTTSGTYSYGFLVRLRQI